MATSIKQLLSDLREKIVDGRIVEPALLAKATKELQWSDDTVPIVVFPRPPAREALAKLERRVEATFGAPLPGDFTELLRLHDGIGAFGVAQSELAATDLSRFDEATSQNVIMSVAMLSREIDGVAELAESGLAPRGILPFHVLYEYEPSIRTAFVLSSPGPSAGKVISFNSKDLPSHQAPDDVANHEVVADTFTSWLEAWFESGFDRNARANAPNDPPNPSDEPEPIGRGDVITVDGKGYHWVTETLEHHGVKKLRFETFATPTGAAKPPGGRPTVADLGYCRKVSEEDRAKVLRLIRPRFWNCSRRIVRRENADVSDPSARA